MVGAIKFWIFWATTIMFFKRSPSEDNDVKTQHQMWKPSSGNCMFAWDCDSSGFGLMMVWGLIWAIERNNPSTLETNGA